MLIKKELFTKNKAMKVEPTMDAKKIKSFITIR